MNKALPFIIVFLVLALAGCASASVASITLFDTVSECTTDELLQLRSLIDEELEQRNVAISHSPVFTLNVNTRKFHLPSCKSVKEIKEKNKLDFFGSRDELIAKEYDPCKNCNP